MTASSRLELDERRRGVLRTVLTHVQNQEPLLVLRAPPGSGKTHVTLYAVVLASHQRMRVAVGTQTNAQADDFCARMAREFPTIPVIRFASASRIPKDIATSIVWTTETKKLPQGPCVVVATTAKWAASNIDEPYDILFVDEAWQMCWADFMLMSRVAPRFVLVGDPGQIPPVVPIDVSRWQTSRRPPHVPAPQVILRDRTLPTHSLHLPVTTRLPQDTTALLQPFYDFTFESWAAQGERAIRCAPGENSPIDRAIDRLAHRSFSLLSLPTPVGGPALDEDLEIATATADTVRRLLARGARAILEDGQTELTPADIGICASHRTMNARVLDALGPLASAVRVDTAERWQGLERKVMLVIHPLSGVTEPSTFDLSTGRLCVMLSRHRIGLIVVSRDHVGSTLEHFLPAAEQPVSQPDEAGLGRHRHRHVWRLLSEADRDPSNGDTDQNGVATSLPPKAAC